MRILAAIAFIGLICAATAAEHDYDVCLVEANNACRPNASPGSTSSVTCNSILGLFEHSYGSLQKYVNSQLASSYDYLLLGTYFDSYQKNRPGFYKLINNLSDKAWNNAINLIKHITKRGGVVDFGAKDGVPSTLTSNNKKLEVDELNALAILLDSEKKLTKDAHHIHREVSHAASSTNHESKHYDPEIAQYIEEEFLEDQAETVRKLSGYTNDLRKLMTTGKDSSLNLFLFDEYLQKQ